MNYWLVKSDPDTYGWEHLVKDKSTDWTGVRNFLARNNMKAMKKGDLAFFYHSMGEAAIVGIAKVVKEAYQDPTTKETVWVTVDVAPYKALKLPVKLPEIKKDPVFEKMDLVRISRLSVGKVSETEFFKICAMGGTAI